MTAPLKSNVKEEKIMYDVDIFTADQKKFLSHIVSDFGGPTSTGSVLYVMQNLLYHLKPEWELSSFSADAQLKADLEVCLAALHYLKVKDVAESS